MNATQKMNTVIYHAQNTWLRLIHWLTTLLEDNKREGKTSIAVLDGVRAVAVILVLTYHINRVSGDNLWNMADYPLASSVSTAGSSGVLLFFVLSGFLLFLPYAKSLLFDSVWPSARSFYLRRAFRIIPAYYVSLILIILLLQPQYLRWDHLQDILLFLTFFMDSTKETFRVINVPYWTLAIEWQFYMLLPLLAWGMSAIVRRVSPQRRLRTVVYCFLRIMAWGLFARYIGLYLTQNPTQTFLVPRLVVNVALFFLYGMQGKYLEVFSIGMLVSLCYVYSQHASTDENYTVKVRRLSPWLWRSGVLLLLFTAMWHFHFEYHANGWPFLSFMDPVYLWLNDPFISLGYGVCVAAILFGSTELKRPFEHRFLRWIGLTSYSIYIWHLPLIVILRDSTRAFLPALDLYTTYTLYWMWALLFIVPFCLLSYALVEKPWMKIGEAWHRTHLRGKHMLGS